MATPPCLVGLIVVIVASLFLSPSSSLSLCFSLYASNVMGAARAPVVGVVAAAAAVGEATVAAAAAAVGGVRRAAPKAASAS